MRLPTKQRYAVRIVVNTARNGVVRPARKKEIAAAENIPADYVEQICVRLKAGGILKSHRGRDGGFSLARPASGITVADVLRAMDGDSALAPCMEGDCGRRSICVTRKVWEKANAALEAVFAGTTIAELAEEDRKLAASGAMSFEI
ncbi:MAG: Rrf2 family transcriptional regulator [bacterium]